MALVITNLRGNWRYTPPYHPLLKEVPQPHLPVSKGLIKTKPDLTFSSTKSRVMLCQYHPLLKEVPQSHLPVSKGLIKTKPDLTLSSTKSRIVLCHHHPTLKEVPQPHLPVSLGLIKTKPDLTFSSTKSRVVPVINKVALGSMKMVTPLSTIFSPGALAS